MPKFGRPKDSAKPASAMKTDPVIESDSSPPRRGAPLKRADTQPDPLVHEDTASLPAGAGQSDDFASDVRADFMDLPVGAGKRGGGSAPPDAWSEFNDQPEDWLKVTTGNLPAATPVAERAVLPPLPTPDGPVPTTAMPEAHFVFLSGAEAGRQIRVSERTMGIGRGVDNGIVLTDPSVSRDHAKIAFADGGFVLMDLQSGNGTFVNGQRVDRAHLHHGDEVAFGSAAFRFVEGHVAAVTSAPEARVPIEPPGRRARWAQVAVVGVVVVLLMTLIAVVYVRRYGGFGNSEARRDRVYAHFIQGVELFKAHHWDQAQEEFLTVLNLDPRHVRGKRYLRAIARERQAEAHLSDAQESAKRGDLARAYTLAQGVLDSSFRPEAQRILREVDTECDNRVNRAQTLMTPPPVVGAGIAPPSQATVLAQLNEAMQLAQSVDHLCPGRLDVAELLIRGKLRGLEAGAKLHMSPATIASRAAQRGAAPLTELLRQAHSQFATDGNVLAALQTLDTLNSEEAAALRDKIERFYEAYQTGTQNMYANHADAAIRALRDARDVAKQISPAGSPLVGDIEHKLADLYYAAGMRAIDQKDWLRAYKNMRQALSFVPNHSGATGKLAELAQKVQDLYDAATKETDVQKARATLQNVMQMLPADSELYRQAKQRLDALP